MEIEESEWEIADAEDNSDEDDDLLLAPQLPAVPLSGSSSSDSNTHEEGGNDDEDDDDDDDDDDEKNGDDDEDGAGVSKEAEAGTSRTSTQYELRDKPRMSYSHFRPPRPMATLKGGKQAGATTPQEESKEMPQKIDMSPLLKQAWLDLGGTGKDFTWLGINSPEDKDQSETNKKETDLLDPTRKETD